MFGSRILTDALFPRWCGSVSLELGCLGFASHIACSCCKAAVAFQQHPSHKMFGAKCLEPKWVRTKKEGFRIVFPYVANDVHFRHHWLQNRIHSTRQRSSLAESLNLPRVDLFLTGGQFVWNPHNNIISQAPNPWAC